jgi:hypothetical protein
MSTKSTDRIFKESFKKAQRELGLTHYRVLFEETDTGKNYATVTREPIDCTAHVEFDPKLLEREDCARSSAVHECVHLAIADFAHACKNCPEHVAYHEEEKLVSRLEALVFKALFPRHKS